MKSVTIPLVAGDGMTAIRMRVDDANSGLPIEALTLSTTTAGMLFREPGAETSIADIALTKLDGGANAELELSFYKEDGSSWLDDLTPGLVYEGQVYLDFDGVRQTVLTKIRFPMQEAFAAV